MVHIVTTWPWRFKICSGLWLYRAILIWSLLSHSQRPWDIKIVAGDVMLDRSSCTSVKRSVSAIFMHEQYNHSTLQNDIALIRVCLYKCRPQFYITRRLNIVLTRWRPSTYPETVQISSHNDIPHRHVRAVVDLGWWIRILFSIGVQVWYLF
jgi:hypothetical protein